MVSHPMLDESEVRSARNKRQPDNGMTTKLGQGGGTRNSGTGEGAAARMARCPGGDGKGAANTNMPVVRKSM